MPTLNDWLREVRSDGVALVRTRVAAPWGFAVPAGDAVVFHFVAQGRAFVRQPGAPTVELQAGELVLFPHSDAHEVAHTATGKAVALATFIARRDGVVDAAAKASTLLCGQFTMDRHLALPALRALPPMVRLHPSALPQHAALGDTLRMLQAEVETPHFGSETVVRNLLSNLFVYFMRAWADSVAPDAHNWFAAVRSPHTARALARIQQAPEQAWTLAQLAEEAGLSRATFARQFANMVGEPPHSYLTRWRMGIAARLLEASDLRLSEIAARVGYQSEFSFSRAFKQARGIAPHHYRRAAVPGRAAAQG